MRATRLAAIVLLGIVFLSAVSCATPTYHLSTSVNGQGSIIPSSGDFLEGRTITVLAKSAPGWQFDRWEGALSGNGSLASLRMNSDKSVTAYFVASNESGNFTAMEFTTYTDSATGFSMSVPASWITSTGDTITMFLSDSSTCAGSSVNVIATETSGLSLQSMHDAALAVVATFSDTTLISDQETTIDGVPAIEVVYIWGSGGFGTTQHMQCYLTKGGMDWVITSTSSPDCWYTDIGTFNTMISSFHVPD